jgi:hypothetical protein
MDNSRQLQRETEAARVLREQLKDLAGDDEETVRDTIEGATSLHELIEAVVEDIATYEAKIEAIDAMCAKWKARKERYAARVESHRAVILNAMGMGEIRKLEFAIATVSRQNVAPKLMVIDEAAIPSEFWKRGDPKLDKKALTTALKDMAAVAEELALAKKNGLAKEILEETERKLKPIPGVTLSNGSETVAIRMN